MERGLLVVALVLSLLVGGVGFLPPRRSFALPWQSALPALVAFLLSLPTSGSFAPGQALGLGVLVGGIFGALAAWLVLQEKPTAAAGLALAPLFLFLMQHGSFPRENLLGATLGLLAALCLTGLRHPESVPSLTLVGSLTVGVGSAAALGTFRGGAAIRGGWLAFAPLFAVGGLVIASVLGYIKTRDKDMRTVIGLVGFFVYALLATRPLALTLIGPLKNVGVLTAAAIAFPLTLMLLWLHQTEKRALSALLIILAITSANHTGQGYAVALLAIGLGLLCLLTEKTEVLLPGLVAAALAALWRLVAQRFEGAHGFGLHEQYLLLGLLLGGLLPRLASGFPGALATGATLLVAPTVLCILYGAPAGLTLVLGLLAGQLWSAATERELTLTPLYSLGVATALAQLLGHLAPLASKTRLDRLLLTGELVLAWAVCLGIGYALARRQK